MTFRTWLCVSTPRSAGRLARPLAVTVLLGGLLLGSSVTDLGAYAQKGGKTPPPPTPVLPNVRYALTWLACFPWDINHWGDVAGFAAGSAVARQSGGTAVNLNYLVDASDPDQPNAKPKWWDLNAPVPTSVVGWWASQAHGINDWGDIVGTATNVNTNVNRAFVLEDAFGDAPRFLLLPTVGAGNQYGSRINNHGDAVGLFGFSVVRYQRLGDAWPVYNAVLEFTGPDDYPDINDDGVIIAKSTTVKGNTVTIRSYRQHVSGAAPDVFLGYHFWSISNGANAKICGTRGERSGQTGGVIRLPVLGTANDAQLIFSGGPGNYARAINDSGDLCFENSGRGYLFFDAINPSTGIRYGVSGDGILPLDALVVTQDQDWQGYMRIDGITNRNVTGLGQICGQANSNRGFLLTPYVPAP